MEYKERLPVLTVMRLSLMQTQQQRKVWLTGSMVVSKLTIEETTITNVEFRKDGNRLAGLVKDKGKITAVKVPKGR